MNKAQRIDALSRERGSGSVKSCWTFHVLADHGKTRRIAVNRLDPNVRMNPCPDRKRPIIEDLLRELGIIS